MEDGAMEKNRTVKTGYIVRSDHALLHGEVDELLSMLNKSILTNKAKLSAPPPSR